MRRTRKTLYVVTSLYVFLGLVILVGAAVIGDPLSSFIGFVIVSGALGAAVVLVNIFRVSETMDRLREDVRTLSDDVHSVKVDAALNHVPPAIERVTDEMASLDLTTLGGGEVLAITAATLDRDRFPRLFVSMDDHERGTDHVHESSSDADAEGVVTWSEASGGHGVASRNLLREWNIAMRSRNLRDGQRIFSALVDLGDIHLVDSLQKELARLADSVEHRFRTEFSALVNARQYDKAMALGDEITVLYAGQPLEAQFLDLRPTLQRAMAKTAALDQTRIVQHS